MLNISSLVRYVLIFGVLAGLSTCVYVWVLHSQGIIPLDGKKAPSVVLSIMCMMLAVKSYRKTKTDEILHFWEGMIVANLTNFVGACVSALFLNWFLGTYDTTIVSRFVTESLQTLALPNVKEQFLREMGEAPYNEAITKFKALTAADLSYDEIFGVKGKLPIGFFVSVMISLFFRRQYVRV
jgi:putative flippase GtrA